MIFLFDHLLEARVDIWSLFFGGIEDKKKFFWDFLPFIRNESQCSIATLFSLSRKVFTKKGAFPILKHLKKKFFIKLWR